MANDRSKGNLGVNVGEDLLERINALAYLHGKSQTQLVKDVLDKETKAHEKEIAAILKLRKKFGSTHS